MLPSRELVVHCLYAAGGATGPVHTEDLALKCWELYPEAFSWARYSQFPDKDSVVAALEEARTVQFGALTASDPEGWTLTESGVDWIAKNLERLKGIDVARDTRHRSTRERILWSSVLLGSILALAVAYSIARLWLIVGSPEGNQIYKYMKVFDVRSLVVWLAASALAGALLALPDAVVRRREWLLVAAWLVVALVVQGMMRWLAPYTLEQIFTHDGANSFYGVTRRYSAFSVLSDFDRLRGFWPLHAQANLPGKLMVVYALKLISRRPAVLAWLVLALSNLGGVLLYIFVRDLFADRLVALFSLVLYLFVPAKLYFFPLLNTVTPVVVLCCACLLLRWLQTSGVGYAALFGASLYGLIFYEPSGLVMGLLFAALLLRALWRTEVTWSMLLRQGSVAVLAFAATYAAVLILFHFNLFGAFRQVAEGAVAFNDRSERPYGIWVRQNLIDFLFGVGICQALVFWVVLGESLRGSEPWRQRLAQPIATICLGLAGVLLATDLLGVNRGEIVRLWIFLACFFQIPAAYACARLHSRTAMVLVIATTLLQDALGTAMIGFIQI